MLPRFHHLLVPLDFTEKNAAALEIAFEIAAHNQARVTLLHVVEEIAEEDEEMRNFVERLRVRATTELERISQRFADAKLEVEAKVRVGHRLQEIIRDATERHADLIVMSSHRVDPGDPFKSWNTLSYQVSVACQSPILLVK